MSTIKKTNRFISLQLLFLLSFSCAGDQTVAAVEALATEWREISCRQNVLELQTAVLWDEVASSLDQHLPPETPAQEKYNMVTVRNADLIRMFETYEALGDSIHRLVDNAERQDQEIVTQVLELKTRRDSLEKERMALFENIEKNNPGRLAEYRQLFQEIADQPCPVPMN